MANFNLNYHQSYAGHFEADGGSFNLPLPFDPDYFVVKNYTKWGTNDETLQAEWYRDFPAGDGLLLTRGTTDLSSTLETTNGFTQANTAAGVDDTHDTISTISQANPGVVTTSAAHGLSTGDRINITKVAGMTELNSPSRNPYQITVLTTTTFSLQDIKGNDIDTSGFTAYSSGGQVNLEGGVGGVIAYDAPVYTITLGTAVDFNNGDEIYFEAHKFGLYEDVGDAADL